MKKALLLPLLLLLASCESAEEKQAKLDAQVTQFVETVAKKDLIDPASAQFRNLKGYCGEINSKNKLGGYVGFQKFIVLDDKTVVFENERNISTKEFPLGWKKICSEQPKFNNENQLVKPKFKLPDPVYDAPKLEANGKTISITPSELAMDQDYNYIYPRLVFRCDENNKLDLTLVSFMQVANHSGYYAILVSDKENSNDTILIDVTSSEIAQTFDDRQKIFNFLKSHNHVTFAFKSISGAMSLQTYDLKPVKEALKNKALKCSW